MRGRIDKHDRVGAFTFSKNQYYRTWESKNVALLLKSTKDVRLAQI